MNTPQEPMPSEPDGNGPHPLQHSPQPDPPIPLPTLTGPGWLAATGAALLLVASVVVVAGQWSSIGPTTRFAGLVGSLVAVFATAEAARHRVRATATSLAVLAACLTAPVAIAAAAALGALWPTCVLAGGVASLVAVNLQARRWDVQTLRAASVAAAGLVAAGLAASTSIPIALYLAGAAALALAVGAIRRSTVLACSVACVPLTWLVARTGVGPGTLLRVGAVAPNWWSIATSGAVAALVVAVSAHRRSAPTLVVTSLSLAVYATVGGAIAASAPPAVWLSLPAVVVASIQVAALVGDRSIFGRWANLSAQASAGSLALGALIAPLLIVSARIIEDLVGGDSMTSQTILPMLTTTASLAVAAVCATSRDGGDHEIDGLTRFGVVAAGLASLLTLGLDVVWVATAALIAWIVSSLATSWRSWIWVSVVHASWATLLIAIGDAGPWWTTSVLLGAGLIVIVAAWSSANAVIHRVALPVTVAIMTPLIAVRWPDGLSVVWATLFVGCAVATAGAMRMHWFGPPDVLAVSFGAAALVMSLTTTPSTVSLTVTLVAAQGWLYAASRNRVDLASVAATTGALALLSLWWTTDTNELVISRLSPYGVDGQDLATAAVSVGLLAAGAALRSVRSSSSWLAYGPGLSTLFAWLAMSQVDNNGGWATGLGVILGVGCIAAGGVQRLGAPLLIGTASLLTTLMISAGPRLATAPTWTWIAAGGIALLITAGLMERSPRSLLRPSPRSTNGGPDTDRIESIAEAFQREFA